MNNNQNSNTPNSPIPNSLTNMQPIMPDQTNNMNNSQTIMPNQNGNPNNTNQTNNINNIPNPIMNTNPNPINNIGNQQNKFINYGNPNETALNDLNVEGTYNKLEKPVYTNEPQVRENIENNKKNTIPVSKELKTVIIIALVLLIFIIFIPMVFEFVNDIRFN